jgi:branched-chain amino acid transport system ATP-binding protein
MKALQIEGLSKNFGGLQVLSNVSFSMEMGEHVAVIGPNGAGKTTFLSLVTGAQQPSQGLISIFGVDVTHVPAHRRARLGLGCSFQINHLFFGLTILDNVLLALYGIRASRFEMWRPVTDLEEVLGEAQRLLQSVDLWSQKDRPVGAISYGEQRKLEIVLGLASQPKLLVLDEPTAGLAIGEVPAFMQTIKDLAQGTSVLFTSHDMDVVFGLADRVIALYFGQVIAQGPPAEIRVHPKVKEIYLGVEEG